MYMGFKCSSLDCRFRTVFSFQIIFELFSFLLYSMIKVLKIWFVLSWCFSLQLLYLLILSCPFCVNLGISLMILSFDSRNLSNYMFPFIYDYMFFIYEKMLRPSVIYPQSTCLFLYWLIFNFFVGCAGIFLSSHLFVFFSVAGLVDLFLERSSIEQMGRS